MGYEVYKYVECVVHMVCRVYKCTVCVEYISTWYECVEYMSKWCEEYMSTRRVCSIKVHIMCGAYNYMVHVGIEVHGLYGVH